ncbi:TPA: AAA family ATPase, partial [Escherichia coli]|nr:AAA family ATPase [Escherichia coli]
AEPFRSSDLKNLMKGQLGSKRSFYEQVKKAPQTTDVNIESLAQEYSILLKNKDKFTASITPLEKYIISEKDKESLSTPIIDSSNSYLSETIKQLQNLDWVKKGKELYLNGTCCPFCQEDTIKDKFLEAIESIFDDSYSKKVDQIRIIRSSYESATIDNLKKIKQEISSCEL